MFFLLGSIQVLPIKWETQWENLLSSLAVYRIHHSCENLPLFHADFEGEEGEKKGVACLKFIPLKKLSDLKDVVTLIETLGFNYSAKVLLSVTQKCTWKCIFCYKNCPKNNEFDPKTLAEIVSRLTAENFRFSLTGGEPTLYPYWRELLQYIKNNDDTPRTKVRGFSP